MKRTTTVLLIGVDLLLLCLLAWLWIDPQGGLRWAHWQPPAAIKPELGSVSAAMVAREDADVARFMAILDRPLFSPTRRPPPPPKPVVVARPDPLDAIHLYGLFGGSGGGGVIVKVEGKTRRVKVSEAIGDWNLKEIRAREVVFARGGETRVVPLVQAKQTAGGSVPPPAFGAPMAPAVPRAGVPPPAASTTGGPASAGAAGAPAAPAAPAAQTPATAPGGQGANPTMPAKQPNPFVIGGSR